MHKLLHIQRAERYRLPQFLEPEDDSNSGSRVSMLVLPHEWIRGLHDHVGIICQWLQEVLCST